MAQDNPFAKYAPAAGTAGPLVGPPKVMDPSQVANDQRDSIRTDIAVQGNTRDDTRTGIAIREEERGVGYKAFDQTQKMRADFDGLPEVKKYKNAIPAYVTALKTSPDAAGDQALIYAFAQVMDPDSVVREADQQMVMAGDTIAGQWMAKLNKELSGDGTFRPQYRADLRRQLQTKIASLNLGYRGARERFNDDAKFFGLEPDRVVGPHAGTNFVGDIDKYWNPDGQPSSDAPKIVIGDSADVNWREAGPKETDVSSAQKLLDSGASADEVMVELARLNLAGTQRTAVEDAIAYRDGTGKYKGQVQPGERRLGATLLAPSYDDQLDRFNETSGKNPEGGQGLFDLAGQGIMWGGGDEAAGVGGFVGAALTGNDPAKGYEFARDAERRNLDQARDAYPKAGLAAEVVGGLAGSGAGGGLVSQFLPKLTTGGAIAQGGKIGGVSGAVTGFNSGEGTVDSFTKAGVYGLGGMVLGGGLPIAGALGRGGVNAVQRARGVDPNVPVNQVRSALSADGTTPRAAANRVAEGQSRGSPMALADTGENARELLASVGRPKGPARTLVSDTAIKRQEGQLERISEAVVRDLGPTANIRELGDELITRAKVDAKPIYEAAFAAPGAGALWPKVKGLLERPSARRAMVRAQRIAAEEGRDPTALGFDLNAAGEVALSRVPSWETLHYIKTGLDDVIEGYRDSTSGKLVLDAEGRAINDTLRTLLKRIDGTNPAYGKARASYAGPARMRDALVQGSKALGRNPDDITAMTKDLGEAELEMFRTGLRKAIVDKIGGQGDYADKVRSLIGTDKARRVLSRVYGGSAKFDRFIATLQDEKAIGQTYQAVKGNSATAARAAFDSSTTDDELFNAVAEAAQSGRGGLIGLIASAGQKVRQASELGAGKAGDTARESIAALLSETDPAELDALVKAARRLAARQKVMGRNQIRNARRGGKAGGMVPVVSSEYAGTKN